MKTFIFLLFVATVASAQTPSLNANVGATTVATATPASQKIVGYQTGAQDGNSRAWQKIIRITDAKGNVTYQTNNAYTELATGLNHLVNGKWVVSKEEIDISADNNSALATNGQHQAYFPGDIYSGQIELVTPDGKQLYSRPVGLSYFDGTNSVLIAELTNSTGEVLPSGNQVLYTNAFTEFGADICYTYSKAGFEQDIILREQPPTPASFGLNPDTTRLQVLTEFFDPPQPTVNTTTLPTPAGNLTDENLNFGTMAMMPGIAFLLGTNSPSVEVNKQWLTLDGRQILVEEVPVVSIADELENLPLPQTTSTKPNAPLNIVSAKRLLPTERMVTIPSKHPMQLAQVTPTSRGLVLDYVAMTSQTNYTFQGDTTYYISGTVNLYGTNTFEGGTVIKYTNSSSAELSLYTQVGINYWTFQTGPYHPAIFTSKNDNSVGDIINGSTGSPTNNLASLTYLNLEGENGSQPIPIQNARFAYAGTAIYRWDTANCSPIYDCQFAHCDLAIKEMVSAPVSTPVQELYNVLISYCGAGIQNVPYYSLFVDSENVTADHVVDLLQGVLSSLSGTFTNCILTSINFQLYIPYGTGAVTNYDCNNAENYQTNGAGYYYLASYSTNRAVGTTNIYSTLLADLQQKTTYPPLLMTNTISVNTNLSPQPIRDTNSSPDLGYHYDPLDYAWTNSSLSNATMTLTNGVAIGIYGPLGLTLENGATLVSQGTPLIPNQLVSYHSVQEQSTILGATNTACSYLDAVATNSVIRLRFTDVSTVAMPHDTIYFINGTGLNSFNLMDCQVSAMLIYIFDPLIVSPGYVGMTNNIFWRCHTDFGNIFNNYSLNFYNNLCFRGEVDFYDADVGAWCIRNNLFDTVTTAEYNTVNDHNGFYNTTGFSDTAGGDQIIYEDDYQAGKLGNYYYPTNGYYDLSWLLNEGSTTASALGLYHYTMTTDQMVESNNIVSIGFHYVAITNGLPLDSNGDGIPDYLEDANGDGVYDAGDLADWLAVINNTVPAAWYTTNSLNPSNLLTGIQDADWDGLLNQQEYLYGSNPQVSEGFWIWVSTPTITSGIP